MPQNKQFDADEISVILNGEVVADLDTIGYDQSKEHEKQEVLGDDGTVWVIASGEFSGTLAVKATSPSIPDLEDIFQNDEHFTLAVKYAESEPRDESDFVDAMLTSFGPADDYEDSGMPMYEGEWEASQVEHN